MMNTGCRYELDTIDRDIIRMALRGDMDLRRYVPEVMRLCARLDITEPPWLDDPVIAERVALNREEWPKRPEQACLREKQPRRRLRGSRKSGGTYEGPLRS